MTRAERHKAREAKAARRRYRKANGTGARRISPEAQAEAVERGRENWYLLVEQFERVRRADRKRRDGRR